MNNKQASFLKNIADGIVDAARDFEKDASFQQWMENDKFREKLAERLAERIEQVRVTQTDV